MIEKRGRPPTTVAGWRKKLRYATLEECEALGRCECGQELASHAPLPKPRPIGAKSAPMSDIAWRSGKRWTAAQRAAHERGPTERQQANARAWQPARHGSSMAATDLRRG